MKFLQLVLLLMLVLLFGCNKNFDNTDNKSTFSILNCDNNISNDIRVENTPEYYQKISESLLTTIVELPSVIVTDTTLTADTIWIINGPVIVKEGATLTIEAGTLIAGRNGTGSETSYIVIDKGSKIVAEGTSDEPIIFTSESALILMNEPEEGQWGGITLIGKAGNEQVHPYEDNSLFEADDSNVSDSSGVLRHVKIFNGGIAMNDGGMDLSPLSLVGVGSGTIIENITIDLSDDDAIDIWGGTVNLTNVTISRAEDDNIDIDDGYTGKFRNLTIYQDREENYSAIEISGRTTPRFENFNIVQNESYRDGIIFFKKDGASGHFKNGTLFDNTDNNFGIFNSSGLTDLNNTSFTNITLCGTSTDTKFSAIEGHYSVSNFQTTVDTDLETKFDMGNDNTK
jgi:hypothetical protein